MLYALGSVAPSRRDRPLGRMPGARCAGEAGTLT